MGAGGIGSTATLASATMGGADGSGPGEVSNTDPQEASESDKSRDWIFMIITPFLITSLCSALFNLVKY